MMKSGLDPFIAAHLGIGELALVNRRVGLQARARTSHRQHRTVSAQVSSGVKPRQVQARLLFCSMGGATPHLQHLNPWLLWQGILGK